MSKKYPNKKIITIIIFAIIIIGTASYFLFPNQNGTKQKEAKIERWYQIDGTQEVGPKRNGLVQINHNDWTPENTTITPGEEIRWSGGVQWKGSETENLYSYEVEDVSINLIISENQKTSKLYCILYLGKYSKNKGIPQPPGGTYIGHDSKNLQELGGQKKTITANLTVSYQPE